MPSEIKGFIFERLNLDSVDENIKERFVVSIVKYLEHGRKMGIVEGRTIEFLEKHLNDVMLFFDSIGLSCEERIIVLTNMPSLLNTSKDLFYKYLLLGIVENEDNTFRKNKLIKKTNDFRIGFKKVYARYVLAISACYPDINWNLLVHSSDNEFAQRFIKGVYYKPYQMFETVEEVMAYIDNVSLEGINIEEIKSWDVNRELVERYGNAKNRS